MTLTDTIPAASYTMNIAELAELLNCSTTALYEDARDGWLEVANGEYVRVLRRGRRVFCGREQVFAALERAAAA